MATEEDVKKAEADDEPGESPAAAEARGESENGDGASVRLGASDEADRPHADDAEEDSDDDVAESSVPMQLGYKRYVYAAYMAFAMTVAFLTAKIGHTAWYRLGQWKPQLGEPEDEILFPIAGVIGALTAVYYWKKADTRQYVNEVAEELSKVTWPSRKEVTNSTTVVVLTTIFATVFFALMDRFWGFVTDHIYSF